MRDSCARKRVEYRFKHRGTLIRVQHCNDQCYVKYVKIADVDYTSNDAGSRPTYYLLFPLCFLSSLITTLSYKISIMYFE